MNTEKIKVRITDTGKTMDVAVLNKRVEFIEVVLGEGIHSVKCQLTPTRNGMAYAGRRELALFAGASGFGGWGFAAAGLGDSIDGMLQPM